MNHRSVWFFVAALVGCSSADFPNNNGGAYGEDSVVGEQDFSFEDTGGEAGDQGGAMGLDVVDLEDGGTTDGSDATNGGWDGDGGEDTQTSPQDPYRVTTPWNFAPGVSTPVVVRSNIGPITAAATVTVGGKSQKIQLYRGMGSGAFVVAASETVNVKVNGTAGFTTLALRADARPTKALSGVLTGDALVWTNSHDIVLAADVTVLKGETLIVEQGVRVVAASKVNLIVEGAMESLGTEEAPVLFAAKDNVPWGGIRALGGSLLLQHTWFTGGGGNGAFVFGHSKSQPVLFVENGLLTMDGGGVVDNPGKAFGGKAATVVLTDTLVSRCDTGGEFEESWVNMLGAYVVEIPNGDGVAADDDNDCIYLLGAMVHNGVERVSTLTQVVFAAGKDDGIDHNNARVVVEGAWIENMAHEGVAASNGRGIVIKNSVIRKNAQGIEAGYGSPDVVVDHCLITENGVGLRFGDEYDWKATGKLTVKNTISVKNTVDNVVNDDTGSGGEVPGAVDIQCSMVNDSQWDGKGGNLPGVPSWDKEGCLLEGSPGKQAACDGKDVGVICSIE